MAWTRFGCCENPFRGAFDERFIYPAPNQEALFEQLLASVPESGSVSLLTGRPGTGKTMLLFRLADRLRRSLPRVAVFATPVTSIARLAIACAELDGRADDQERQDPVVACQRILLDSMSGRRWVLLFDEAQALTDEVLRFLLDFTTSPGAVEKAPSILLAGQDALEDRLKEWSLARAVQGAWSHYRLAPFSASDVAPLIRHRMQVAGCSRLDILSPAALESIVHYSGANPGRLLALFNLALFLADEAGDAEVSREAVERAASAILLRGESESRSRPHPVRSWESVCDLDSPLAASQQADGDAALPAEQSSGRSKLNQGEDRHLRFKAGAQNPMHAATGHHGYWVAAVSALGLGILVGFGWLLLDDSIGPAPGHGPSAGTAVTLAGEARGSSERVAVQAATEPAPTPKVGSKALTRPPLAAGSNTPRIAHRDEERRPESTEVRLLLSLAKTHLKADRLTAPRFDNALYIYRKVLQIEPGNRMAQSGLQAIRVKLRRFAEEERARGNEASAQRQLQKLNLLGGLD